MDIPLSKIEANPFNHTHGPDWIALFGAVKDAVLKLWKKVAPSKKARTKRSNYTDTGLLADIRDRGRIMVPVSARPNPDKAGFYQLAHGHHRLWCANDLGHPTLPAIVEVLTDRQMFDSMVAENSQRRDPKRARFDAMTSAVHGIADGLLVPEIDPRSMSQRQAHYLAGFGTGYHQRSEITAKKQKDGKDIVRGDELVRQRPDLYTAYTNQRAQAGTGTDNDDGTGWVVYTMKSLALLMNGGAEKSESLATMRRTHEALAIAHDQQVRLESAVAAAKAVATEKKDDDSKLARAAAVAALDSFNLVDFALATERRTTQDRNRKALATDERQAVRDKATQQAKDEGVSGTVALIARAKEIEESMIETAEATSAEDRKVRYQRDNAQRILKRGVDSDPNPEIETTVLADLMAAALRDLVELDSAADIPEDLRGPIGWMAGVVVDLIGANPYTKDGKTIPRHTIEAAAIERKAAEAAKAKKDAEGGTAEQDAPTEETDDADQDAPEA